MKLESILSITRQDINVNIVNYDTQEVISRYDGKESIDIELNEKEVYTQYIKDNELYIVIFL